MRHVVAHVHPRSRAWRHAVQWPLGGARRSAPEVTVARLTWIFALVLAVGLGAFARPTAACTACACGDPTLTSMGAERPAAGMVRVGMRAATTREQSPDVLVRGAGVSLLGMWMPLDGLALAAELPVRWAAADLPDLRAAQSVGMGEPTLRARYFVWRDRPFLPRFHLAVTGAARLPQWAPVTDAQGEALPLDAQPGLGSWFGELGVLALGRWDALSAMASVRGAAASTTMDGRQPGAALLLSAWGNLRATGAVALRAGLESRHSLDTLGPDGAVDTPGGTVVQLGSAVLWQFAPAWTAAVTLRLPVVDTRWPGPRGAPGDGPTGQFDLVFDLPTA